MAQIQAYLISHCERMRYRIAVLDSPDDQTVGGVRSFRGQEDSTHGALYYPWVRVVDPVTEDEMILPPSGFVAGIYARNDVEKGVHKAPANEVVRIAVGFEFLLNKAQQDVLNPEGVNCFRFFEGRGYRLWGAHHRSDPEWKYVNLRRYFAYLGVRWKRARNGWSSRTTMNRCGPTCAARVEDFLFNEWKSGHLMGEKPQSLLRALRPLNHDPERHRQRPADLPDRRGPRAPGRVRHLPHRAVDSEVNAHE